MISFASATTNDYPTVANGDCITLKQGCSSCTYVNVSVSYPNSSIAVSNVAMISQGAGQWSYDFCDINDVGRYDVAGEGDILGIPTSFDTLWFDANEGGVQFTQERTNMTIFLLTILFIMFVGSIIFMVKSDHYISKFVLYWVSHILILIITFIAWQVGVEGSLSSTGMTGVFHVLFFIFSIAVFPMVIVSMAWILYLHAYNENFEKVIKNGGNTEEAFRVADKKSSGWFNGR